MVPVIPDVSADFYAFKTFDVRLFHSCYILHTQKTRHLLHKERTISINVRLSNEEHLSAARANQTYQKRGKGKGFWSAGQHILSFIQGKKSLIPTDEKIPKLFETII